MKNKKKHASPEAAPKSSINVTAQANPAKPDKAITLVAITPDGATANLATVLFPEEDSSSTPNNTKLSAEERSSLERLEQVIERGIATFVEVGAALYQIQSQRLYRRKHDSFEAYLAGRWNFKRAHAYRLISAYRVLETIRDEDGKELAESHVRQLVRLPKDQRAEALRRAKELAGKGPRTAKHIQQVVDAMLGKTKKSPSKPSDDEEQDNNDGGAPAETPTPPSAPTGGAAAPHESTNEPAPSDLVLVNELLALVRQTRDLLTLRGDVNAAIQQLFRMEHVLTRPAAPRRYNALDSAADSTEEESNTATGPIKPQRQLQAA